MFSKKRTGKAKNALYRFTPVNSYATPAHVFALDYYEPNSDVEDEFSRKEVWFYYMGGDKLREEFSARMEDIIQDLFVQNSIEWDYFTLAPSHEKDSLNENMLAICNEISEKGKLEFRQVLRRKRGVKDTGELGSVKQMVINQQDSIEVTENVEGANIIIIDNVSVTGVYLSYITQHLHDAGAKTVCCLCLGVTNHDRDVVRMSDGVTASKMVEKSGDGDSNE